MSAGSVPSSTFSSPTAPSRRERKEITRRAIMHAALDLTAEQGFAGLSLRRVARTAGIAPAAFYRHFEDMDALGLALVEASFATLRQMLRDARRDPRTYENVIDSSARIIVGQVKAHRAHFAFIARERFGGVPAVRDSIRNELRLFVSELAIDLSRLEHLDTWSAEDVQMAARLFVNNLVSTAEQVVDLPEDRPDLEAEVEQEARRQMRLIVLGFAKWRSR